MQSSGPTLTNPLELMFKYKAEQFSQVSVLSYKEQCQNQVQLVYPFSQLFPTERSDYPHKEIDCDTYILFVTTYVVDEGVFSKEFLA